MCTTHCARLCVHSHSDCAGRHGLFFRKGFLLGPDLVFSALAPITASNQCSLATLSNLKLHFLFPKNRVYEFSLPISKVRAVRFQPRRSIHRSNPRVEACLLLDPGRTSCRSVASLSFSPTLTTGSFADPYDGIKYSLLDRLPSACSIANRSTMQKKAIDAKMLDANSPGEIDRRVEARGPSLLRSHRPIGPG